MGWKHKTSYGKRLDLAVGLVIGSFITIATYCAFYLLYVMFDYFHWL